MAVEGGVMFLVVTFYKSDAIVACSEVSRLHEALKFAKEKLPVHRLRSGATRVDVRDGCGLLLYDSRIAPRSEARRRTPTLV